MRAQDLKSFNEPPLILIVGTAGCGKTALVSQVGKEAYLFDCDKGMRTALNLKDKFTKLRHATEFDIYVDEDIRTPTMFKALYDKVRGFREKPPKALVIDSLTGLTVLIRFAVMGREGNAEKQPKIQHLGMMINELEKVIFTLRSFKCPILMTAHDAFVQDENSVVHHVIASVTKPHGRNKLAWLFDEVLYMKTRFKGAGKVDYALTARGEGLPARTRSSLFDAFAIDDIGLQGLFEKVGYKYDPVA